MFRGGTKLAVGTDLHQLNYFKSQTNLSRPMARWMEYPGQFDYELFYLNGISKISADAHPAGLLDQLQV